MNNIRFRAWDKEEKRYWSHDEIDKSDTDGVVLWGELMQGKQHGFDALEQFTGLKDKAGNDIYEGDILRDSAGSGVVQWMPEHCAFLVRAFDPHGYHYLESDGTLKETVVIGNIHEGVKEA